MAITSGGSARYIFFESGCIWIACTNEVITGKNAKDIRGLVLGQYVSLTIKDNGKGRDGETRRKVFERFFTTTFKGHGLGMATAYGIVNNHGGPITVE